MLACMHGSRVTGAAAWVNINIYKCAQHTTYISRHTESWQMDASTPESVASHVIDTREKLSKMSELVHENMAKAQKEQKRWYDRNARERSFQTGDQVLVLLPTSSNKLTSQWHGPYPVTKKASNVNSLKVCPAPIKSAPSTLVKSVYNAPKLAERTKKSVQYATQHTFFFTVYVKL